MTTGPLLFLSRAQLAARIGVKPDTLNRYTLPEPDAIIGRGTAAERPGWLEATVDSWNAARPGTSRRRAG
ncbi:helix-turn-helix transcriptional regulator [Georgenia sp. MJ170]|uniref:helix-turn-helix transcriptional regulator n=1 Tax=Georgenia sunbinii TaxID=3117728 RepID=UPI002F264CFF